MNLKLHTNNFFFLIYFTELPINIESREPQNKLAMGCIRPPCFYMSNVNQRFSTGVSVLHVRRKVKKIIKTN